MLARSALPLEYARWNKAHGAPFGRPTTRAGRYLRRMLGARAAERMRGPFQYQPNNTTRAFEYPWAFTAGEIRPGLDVLEIGGGLSGFQFVLSGSGCNVTNVDPGMERDSFSWPCDEPTIARLNALYGTSVTLRNTVLDDAGLSDASFDVAFSVSVLEHLSEPALRSAMLEAYRVLRPGGRLVMTIDLFLNVHPFTSAKENRFGTNIDVRELLAYAPFELVIGDTRELNGFPDFSVDDVLTRLDEFLLGGYPSLTQCLVLRKPAATAAA